MHDDENDSMTDSLRVGDRLRISTALVETFRDEPSVVAVLAGIERDADGVAILHLRRAALEEP